MSLRSKVPSLGQLCSYSILFDERTTAEPKREATIGVKHWASDDRVATLAFEATYVLRLSDSFVMLEIFQIRRRKNPIEVTSLQAADSILLIKQERFIALAAKEG